MTTILAVLDHYSEAEGLAYDLMVRGFKRENIEVGTTVKGEAVKRKAGKEERGEREHL